MRIERNSYVKGLVSVSFRGQSPEEIVRAAAEAGLSCIEWGSDVHAPCNETERLQEIVRLQTEYHINCSSYGTYFRLGVTPLDELDAYIDAAKMLGTDVLRLWCGSTSGREMKQDERDALMWACQRAASLAEARGVTICTECHKNTFTEDPEDTVALMQSIGSTHFKTYWQPFQWLTPEENLQIARQVAPYTEHLHVFHWRGAEKLPLADAVDTWRDYLRVFPKPKTLLLEFMPDGRLESLAGEARALQAVIGGTL